MNKLIIIMIFGLCFTQTYEDVIILKNGGEVHGFIIEQKHNEYIKIKSGENIFVFQIDEIVLIKKELINASNNSSDIINKKSSIGIGFLTNKSMNFIQYTYDLKLSKNVAIFGILGYGNTIGLGLAWQSHYNANGMMVGWSRGTNLNGYSFGSFALSYQWRLSNQPNFISLGITSYAYIKEYINRNETITAIYPILSFDRRF